MKDLIGFFIDVHNNFLYLKNFSLKLCIIQRDLINFFGFTHSPYLNLRVLFLYLPQSELLKEMRNIEKLR